jgi:hypothetical protein
MVAAIIMGQLDPYRPRLETQVSNPYGPMVGCLEHTTVDDHAHVQRQVSPDGGDHVDHGDDPHDIPQTNSADISQPQLEDIAQPESEAMAQPEVPALPVLKKNEVWMISMFRHINM